MIIPVDLNWELASKVGFDLNTNKALHQYYKYGDAVGVLGMVRRWFETDTNVREFALPWERKAMALLMYNRHMNGSKIPGVSRLDNPSVPYAKHAWETIGTNTAYRTAAFQEVQAATLERWHNAIKIIDQYKGANNV